MSLSCSCDWEPEPGAVCYCYDDTSLDFEKLKTSRRKRCCSCGELINIDSLCIIHPRYRYPHNDIEARIVGADPDLNEEPPIKIANHYQCEQCAEIWLNLTSLGYECLLPCEKMSESLKEYHEISGFNPSQSTTTSKDNNTIKLKE